VTSTLKETTAPVETTSAGMLVPEALAGAVRQSSSVAPAPVQQEDEAVIGYTEAPDQKEPQVMEKQIASCGDPSIHETGTTFFTAGKSGWTANCAAQIM
jgi:putative secreted protein